MSGPKPTPTATLANRGSWRADTRPNEPKPELVTDVKPPRGLTGPARKLWQTLAPRLVANGLLTTADVQTFERYVRLYAAWSEAMKEVEAKPERSNVLALKALDEMLRRLEANFGLSPADRTGIQVDPPKGGDPKSRFFEVR